MTWYGFESQIAIDQSTEQVVRNAAGHVYAKTDLDFEFPLPVTDLAGVVRSEIIANGLGLIEEFRVEDHKVVVWKSGEFKTQLASIDGFVEDVEAARIAAQGALTAVTAYIAANPALPADRQVGQILGVLDGNTLGWVSPSVLSGIVGAPNTWPTSFAPSPHNHSLAQIDDASPLGRKIAAALDDAAARTLIKAAPDTVVSFPGFGTATDAGKAAPSNHGHKASAITFDPVGAITATNVQDAVAQAATLGGSGSGGAGDTMKIRYASGAWPNLTATPPAGILYRVFYGPVPYMGVTWTNVIDEYKYLDLV